jgi:hypothetical protein
MQKYHLMYLTVKPTMRFVHGVDLHQRYFQTAGGRLAFKLQRGRLEEGVIQCRSSSVEHMLYIYGTMQLPTCNNKNKDLSELQ